MGARPSWLQVTPASGTAPTLVTCTPALNGLPLGAYSADVGVMAAGAASSPQTIHVTLNIFGFDLFLPIIRR